MKFSQCPFGQQEHATVVLISAKNGGNAAVHTLSLEDHRVHSEHSGQG